MAAKTLRGLQLEADIEALKAVMSTGVLNVSFADRRIQYSSYDDQAKALARLERELKATETVTHRPTRRYYGFSQAR